MKENINQILKEMQEGILTKEPIVYFEKLLTVLSLLSNKIDLIHTEVVKNKQLMTLSIEWDSKIARDLLTNQINELRSNKDVYFKEISALKEAYIQDEVTKSYSDFCSFWQETLGWHPFIGT